MGFQVGELELSAGVSPIPAPDGLPLRLLVRLSGRPLGWLTLEPGNEGGFSRDRIWKAVLEQLEAELLAALASVASRPEAAAVYPTPPVSVVICTRDRTDLLAGCLLSLLSLDYPDYEIIVVDNAPATGATAELCSRLPVRYVLEAQPGLDRARNAGILAAAGSIVAFTDDDARPDRAWLRAVARSFHSPEVMAVTGAVAPVELSAPAQTIFEMTYGGMSHGYARQVYTRENLTVKELLWASRFGVGANMAFRKAVFTEVGYFDPALDVGTPSGGGGDVEMFHRVVACGYPLVYEPAALVWHTHRRELPSLRRLVFNNGRSFGCYLMTCWRRGSVPKHSILAVGLWSWLGGWILRRVVRPGRFPYRLVLDELAGALLSPLYYLAAQREARREEPGRQPGNVSAHLLEVSSPNQDRSLERQR